jgi:Ras family protein A
MSDIAWIDSWRSSVPSRLEREDPFKNDGFQARCPTRVVRWARFLAYSAPGSLSQTFREPDQPPRTTSRLGIFRSATPFQRLTVCESPEPQPEKKKKRKPSLLGFFSRKRKQPSSSAGPQHISLRFKFLFVGHRSCGQTALL